MEYVLLAIPLLLIAAQAFTWWEKWHKEKELKQYYERQRLEDEKRKEWATKEKPKELVEYPGKVLEGYLALSTKKVNEIRTMRNDISACREILQVAEAEFQQRAFSSFWDQIPKAAQHVTSYMKKLELLNESVVVNPQLMNASIHDLAYKTFYVEKVYVPLTTLLKAYTDFRPEEIPDIAPTLSEMRRIIRLGETDYQFANIYEQKKIQKILLNGFDDMGRLIREAGAVVSFSIENAQRTVSSQLAAQSLETKVQAKAQAQQLSAHLGVINDNVRQLRWYG